MSQLEGACHPVIRRCCRKRQGDLPQAGSAQSPEGKCHQRSREITRTCRRLPAIVIEKAIAIIVSIIAKLGRWQHLAGAIPPAPRLCAELLTGLADTTADKSSIACTAIALLPRFTSHRCRDTDLSFLITDATAQTILIHTAIQWSTGEQGQQAPQQKHRNKCQPSPVAGGGRGGGRDQGFHCHTNPT